AVLDGENLPVFGRKPHCGDDVLDSYDNGGRLEPAGPLDAEQVGLRGALRAVEISRNANRRRRQQRGINAGCFSARRDDRQQQQNQRAVSPSTHQNNFPFPPSRRSADSGMRQEHFTAYPKKFTGVRVFLVGSHFFATQSDLRYFGDRVRDAEKFEPFLSHIADSGGFGQMAAPISRLGSHRGWGPRLNSLG